MNITAEILKRLDLLAAKFGATGSELAEIIVKDAVVRASIWQPICVGIAILAIIIILLFIVLTIKDDYCDGIGVWGAILVFIFIFLPSVSGFVDATAKKQVPEKAIINEIKNIVSYIGN